MTNVAISEDHYPTARSAAPWEANPYGLVSWWDVERFSAEEFFAIVQIIKVAWVSVQIPKRGIGGTYEIDHKDRDSLAAKIRDLANKCESIGLTISTKNAYGLYGDLMRRNNLNNVWAAHEISKALEIIYREMEDHLFLHVGTERSKWYVDPRSGWKEVIERFPTTVLDIEEAGRCLALDRYGGAVFHVLLVAEVGAIEIGKLIEINDQKLGWPATVREMNRIVHKEKYQNLKPIEQKHRGFLEQLLTVMESMQTGWRNKISHVDNKLVLMTGEFGPQVAEEIIVATRGFMRRLATELPRSRMRGNQNEPTEKES